MMQANSFLIFLCIFFVCYFFTGSYALRMPSNRLISSSGLLPKVSRRNLVDGLLVDFELPFLQLTETDCFDWLTSSQFFLFLIHRHCLQVAQDQK